jgi:hypothetical protein
MVFLCSEKTQEFRFHGHNRSKYKVFRVLSNYRHVTIQMYLGTLPGLCKVATVADIEAQGWSLNPGRYVGGRSGLMMTGSSASG